MPIKVSYRYCEWSDREEIRQKDKRYQTFVKESEKTSKVNKNGK